MSETPPTIREIVKVMPFNDEADADYWAPRTRKLWEERTPPGENEKYETYVVATAFEVRYVVVREYPPKALDQVDNET